MTTTPTEKNEFITQLGDQSKGNKSLIAELGWEKDRYAKVKQTLLDEGIIEKRKGYGGSVVKIKDSSTNSKLKETEIYDPIIDQLKEMWLLNNALDEASIISKKTAQQGKRNTGGKWSRPDITFVTFKKYRFIPLPTLEVVTFELKTDLNSMNIACVYEALAQQRSAHKAYVVLVSGNATIDEIRSKADDISEECGKHGLGLILIDDMRKHETWEIVLDAQRNEPDPENLNSFISTQLGQKEHKTIESWYSTES